MTNCTETCPEDCASGKWLQLGGRVGAKKHLHIKLTCSRVPQITHTVEQCMEDFDMSKHPNFHLLPKACGKQSTGVLSTVSLEIYFAMILSELRNMNYVSYHFDASID